MTSRKPTRSSRRTNRDALAILERVTGKDARLRRMIEEETVNAEVARMVYDARTAAGLTQAQLARLIGSTQPVIARLEDADYRGHSLTMLRRIAMALGKQLEVRFTPRRSRSRAA